MCGSIFPLRVHQHVLRIVPGHFLVLPDTRPDPVDCHIAVVLEQFYPIFRPLFVYVILATLEGDCGGEKNNRTEGREGLHECCGALTAKVFGDFQRDYKIEFPIHPERSSQIHATKLIRRNSQTLSLDPGAIHSPDICHSMAGENREPDPGTATYIDHACRMNQIDDERGNLLGGRGAALLPAAVV